MVTVNLARMYLAAAHSEIPTPPAGTIRCWISRGFVKRTEDGSVDLASLVSHVERAHSCIPSPVMQH